MKKLTLLATMFAALTFASCGGSKEEGTDSDSTDVATDTTAVEEVIEDVAVDTTAAGDTTATAE